MSGLMDWILIICVGKRKIIMKITLLILVTCVLCGAIKGQPNVQNVYGTYQGKIVGVSSLILHLKIKDGVATGFYKSLSDSAIVQFRGNMDSEGNLVLTTTKKPYSSFSGKLEGKVIKGSFTRSRGAASCVFYACDLRGIYKDLNDGFSFIALSGKGYLRNGSLITICMDDEGRISVIDSLNGRFYVKGDTLVPDNEDVVEEHRVYVLSDNFYDSSLFVEFPEMIKEFSTYELGSSPRQYRLEGNLSVSIRQIPYSDYILAKWQTAYLSENKPYKVIADNNSIVQILKAKGKIEIIEQKIDDEDRKVYEEKGVKLPNRYLINVIYNNGVKRIIMDYYDPLSDYAFFIGYYPELDILVFEEEAGGDCVVDFNDSSDKIVNNQSYARNPHFDSSSPDGKLLITGYYPGGAAEGISWHIERWNSNKKRYEFVAFLDLGSKNYDFTYLKEGSAWFWSDINKVMFKSPDNYYRNYYYEMEIFEN